MDLLVNVEQLVRRYEQVEQEKGERFNIFTILDVETRENKTHSAFIAELLNPKGTHLLGAVFLDLFLTHVVKRVLQDTPCALDSNTTKVTVEEHVGVIDYENTTGGRIDIYLIDHNGNTISVENKIYAGDQAYQLHRYKNHNASKNLVLYLNLWGSEPSAESKSAEHLIVDEDYYIISYQNDIVEWLNHCIIAAQHQPILRETIRQYQILIKKLTNQSNFSGMNDSLTEEIQKHYKAAALVYGKFRWVELEQTKLFLDELKKKVLGILGTGWEVDVDDDLDVAWTGFKLRKCDWINYGMGKINVKLEGSKKVPWDNSIYGLKTDSGKFDPNLLKASIQEYVNVELFNGNNKYWPFYKSIFSMNTTEKRARLFDNDERLLLVKQTAEQLTSLAKGVDKGLKKYMDENEK